MLIIFRIENYVSAMNKFKGLIKNMASQKEEKAKKYLTANIEEINFIAIRNQWIALICVYNTLNNAFSF